MTLQQLRQVQQIAATHSLSAAARALEMAQPNLSRSLKELEKELGVPLFRRTARGMEPTAAGSQFLRYAGGILAQVEELQSLYTPQPAGFALRVTVPRATYIADAFAAMLAECLTPMNVQYREAGLTDALQDAASGESELSIIRYQDIYQPWVDTQLAQNSLQSRVLRQYRMCLLMSERHPLAGLADIPYHLLGQYPQILHGDVQLPVLEPEQRARAAELRVGESRIYVYDRGSQFALLRQVPGSYMWVSPLSAAELARQQLVQKPCAEAGLNRDAAIWPAAAELSDNARRTYANSPHKFVDKWDTPILIITGEKDYRIPYTQSLEAFTAARVRGIPARLLEFEDEAHQVFKPQNSMVWNREFFGWLDRYVKQAE